MKKAWKRHKDKIYLIFFQMNMKPLVVFTLLCMIIIIIGWIIWDLYDSVLLFQASSSSSQPSQPSSASPSSESPEAKKPAKTAAEYQDMYNYLKGKYSLQAANQAFLGQLNLLNRYSSEEEIQQAIDSILRTGIVPETSERYTTKVTELVELRDKDLPSHRGYGERKADVDQLNAMIQKMQTVLDSSGSTEDEKVSAQNDLTLALKIRDTAMKLFREELSRVQNVQSYLADMTNSGQLFIL